MFIFVDTRVLLNSHGNAFIMPRRRVAFFRSVFLSSCLGYVRFIVVVLGFFCFRLLLLLVLHKISYRVFLRVFIVFEIVKKLEFSA